MKVWPVWKILTEKLFCHKNVLKRVKSEFSVERADFWFMVHNNVTAGIQTSDFISVLMKHQVNINSVSLSSPLLCSYLMLHKHNTDGCCLILTSSHLLQPWTEEPGNWIFPSAALIFSFYVKGCVLKKNIVIFVAIKCATDVQMLLLSTWKHPPCDRWADWAQHSDVMMMMTWWLVLHVSPQTDLLWFKNTFIPPAFPTSSYFPSCPDSLCHLRNLLHLWVLMLIIWYILCKSIQKCTGGVICCSLRCVRAHLHRVPLSFVLQSIEAQLVWPWASFFNGRSKSPVHADANHVGSFPAPALRYTIA